MASLLTPLNLLFKPTKSFVTMPEVEDQISQINRLLSVQYTVDFLQEFDLSGYKIDLEGFEAPDDVCFVDIKLISQYVIGKTPPFNQCKGYYKKMASKLLIILLKIRLVLQEIIFGQESDMPLLQLVWNYQLYIQYNEMHQIDLTPQEQSGQAYSISTQRSSQSQETIQNGSLNNSVEISQSNENNLLQEILDELIIDGVCEKKNIKSFLLQLSAFIQKWQYVFVRLTSSPGDTCLRIQDLVNQLHKPHIQLDLEQFYQIRPSLQLFLRQFSFEEVRQFCEVVQQYIVSKERVCFINAVDFLVLFCLEGKYIFSSEVRIKSSEIKNQQQNAQKSMSRQSNRPGSSQQYGHQKGENPMQNNAKLQELYAEPKRNVPCLDILLAETFDTQIMKLAAKSTPLISAEFYALLFCFMLSGQVVFFGAREVEAVMEETMDQILSLSTFSTVRNLSDVLFQINETMKGVQVEYENRPVRIRLPDKNLSRNFKKMFPIEDGEAMFELVYNKLVLLLLKAQIYTGEEGMCSIIHCCYKIDGNSTYNPLEWAQLFHKGIQTRVRAELEQNSEINDMTDKINITGEQEVLGIQHVPNDVLDKPNLNDVLARRDENKTNNSLSENPHQEHTQVMHQRYLPIQTQIEIFGRSFTSAEEAAQFLGSRIATSVNLKKTLSEYQRIVADFKAKITEISDGEFKTQLLNAANTDDVAFAKICARVKRQTQAANALTIRINTLASNREKDVFDELEKAFSQLQMQEFPGSLVNAFLEEFKQVMARDAESGTISINERNEFLQNYVKILNSSVNEILSQFLQKTEVQLRLSLYQRLKHLIADAVVIPKERFLEIEAVTKEILKNYQANTLGAQNPQSDVQENEEEYQKQLENVISYVKEKTKEHGMGLEEASCGAVIGVLHQMGLEVNYDEIMAQVI